MPKTILFHRQYRKFQGGHLKVFDYFGHAGQSPDHRAEIFLTDDSRSDHLWRDEANVVDAYHPERADILFLAGLDWLALRDHPGIEERVPVINLVQHVRHASPEDPRYQFLSRRAVRICVSLEVGEAIEATGRCNGTIHIIPNGIDFGLLPGPCLEEIDVLIAGLKRPELAVELADRLRARGLTVECLTSQIERSQFLSRMGRARIVVTLMHEREGFPLPPLEAMALGRPLVCPACVGTRLYCRDGETCLMPPPEPTAIEQAVLELLENPTQAEALRSAGLECSKQFDLPRERSAFLAILNEL